MAFKIAYRICENLYQEKISPILPPTLIGETFILLSYVMIV